MSTQSKGTLIHAAVLGVSVIAAVGVWTREKEPKALAQGDVTVWSGRSADVEKITYENKTRKVAIEAKKDATGRYFVGTLERENAPALGQADGGAPPPAPKPTTVSFVSVGPGDKLADALAPLKALRALGKIGDDRAAEFGLKEPEATVTIKVGGADHKLVVGGTTPGGGDRYVRVDGSGEVYVLKGEPLRNLESPDSLLLERELHEWKDSEVQKARVEAAGKGRDLVRGGAEGKRFWADGATPETNDETLGNWMSKLDRLRPTEFLLNGPDAKETLLKVEYTGRKPLGFVEVIKVSGGEKPAFYLRTERTRLYGKVVGTLAEQLEQDLGTIVK
ncbi:Hypothetical protein A7982_05034 [Minicystis rosea]|nr:Hypothetical protein A7982_05034 [Minicystis rosea]